MGNVKASVLWDYAMRAAIPLVVAASGMAIRAELRLQHHEDRIGALERAEEDRRASDRDRLAIDRQLLEELAAIRVAIARLEERSAK